MNICLKYEKLWNSENHYTNCRFGYPFVTSLPHYLSTALYIFIPFISLFIPKYDFPMPLPRLYDFTKSFMNFEELIQLS